MSEAIAEIEADNPAGAERRYIEYLKREREELKVRIYTNDLALSLQVGSDERKPKGGNP